MTERDEQFADDMDTLTGALAGMKDLAAEWEAEDALEEEVAILRKLVRDVRDNHEKHSCGCHLINDFTCERCFWMDRIDTDLARIGELKNG